MIRLGLIGYPLGHSLSPKIHSAALEACGIEGNYLLFPTHPDNQQGLKDLLGRVRSDEITGLNVTIPHKQNVISSLDKLTSTAEAIGAVNTIWMQNGKLTGDNTDVPGFLADLKFFFGDRELGIGNRKVALILGAGGSARAVVHALVNDGWDVTIAARRIEQAEELARNYELHTIHLSNLQSFVAAQDRPSTFNLIINTTPLGMSPHVDVSPWPDDLPFPPNAAVYDLVYNPRETKLVRDARVAGLSATTGLGMLIEQAALAFKIWTECSPPREKLWDALKTEN